MRYTIRGRRATIARRDVRTYGLTRVEAWRIDCLAARLERARPVHRERVRFGAWEAADRARVREYVCCERVGKDRHPCTLWTRHHGPHQAWEPPKPCACCQITWAIPDEATRAALARSGAGAGVGEGPADSDGSQTYKRAVCGDRECGGYECEVVDR